MNIEDIAERMEERFDKLEKTMKLVLDIVRTYDQEKKEMKEIFWEHDRRLINLENQSS
ncbi:hypothetical protein KKF32_04715 [Patescibacteria group bacterium]|nr:hypothetical protein [Patescibacteria group bacterium]